MLKTGKSLNFRSCVSLVTTCLLLHSLSGSAVAQQTASQSSQAAGDIIFTVVERYPEFPGGNEALQKYLAANLKYPEGVNKKLRKKRVFTNFIVTKTGAIDSVRVLRGVHDLIDAEVVRVLKSMPSWRPGNQRGRDVAVSYNLPVLFP
jgi:protein TonB